MEDAVKLFTRMRWLSPLFWCLWDIINWQNLAPSDYLLFGPMKGGLRGKHYVSENFRDKLGLKNNQQNFRRLWYMLSFEGKTLLLRETETMLRRRNVIHSELASFLCMIHVPVSVIIPVLKKKVSYFFIYPYIYIYIYILLLLLLLLNFWYRKIHINRLAKISLVMKEGELK